MFHLWKKNSACLFSLYDTEQTSFLHLGKLSDSPSLDSPPTLYHLAFQCYKIPPGVPLTWSLLPVSPPLGHLHLFPHRVYKLTFAPSLAAYPVSRKQVSPFSRHLFLLRLHSHPSILFKRHFHLITVAYLLHFPLGCLILLCLLL